MNYKHLSKLKKNYKLFHNDNSVVAFMITKVLRNPDSEKITDS